MPPEGNVCTAFPSLPPVRVLAEVQLVSVMMPIRPILQLLNVTPYAINATQLCMQLFGVRLGTVLGCMLDVFGHCNVLLPLHMLSHICVPNKDVRNVEEQWLKPFGMPGIVICVA